MWKIDAARPASDFGEFLKSSVKCSSQPALYAIAKGAETLAEPLPALGFETFSVLFFVIGILVMVLLHWLKRRAEKSAE